MPTMSTLTGRFLLLACVVLAVPAPARADGPAAPDRKPTEPKKPRTDRYGDPLPEGAIARIGTVRWRHVGAFFAAYGPDGKTLVSVADNSFRVWEVATGRKLREVTTKPEIICGAQSPDGKIVALAASDNGISLYETHTGKKLRRIKTSGNLIDCMAFAPDGKILAVSNIPGGRPSLWEVATGNKLPELEEPKRDGDAPDIFEGHFERAFNLAFSPNGKELAATARTGGICIWKLATGKLIRRIKGNVDWRNPLAYSPDGKMMAWEKEGAAIGLADAATGKELRVLRGFDSTMSCLTFSPNSKILASVHGQEAHLWDVVSGKYLRRLEGDLWGIHLVTFSPDGKSLATALNCCIRRWDVATGEECLPPDGRLGAVMNVALSPDARTLATASWEGDTRLWEMATGKPLHRLGKVGSGAAALAFSPDSKTIATRREDEPVQLWNVATGKEKGTLKGQEGPGGVTFTLGNAAVIGACTDGTAYAWDASTGKVRHRFHGPMPGKPYWEIALSSDGRLFAWSRLRTVWLSEGLSGKSLPACSIPHGKICRVAISRDNKTLAVWALSPQRLGRLEGADDTKPGFLYMYETATGKERCRFQGVAGDVDDSAFSPDGRVLALTLEDTVRLWSVAGGKEVAQLKGHQGKVTGIAFCADGTKLASSSIDTTVLVWDRTAMKSSKRPPPLELSTRQLDGLWADLAGDDAPKAYRAIGRLAAAKGSVSFLNDKLQQAAQATLKQQERIPALLADLDAESFKVRDKASRDLAELGDLAEPMLRQALTRKLSVESRRRIKGLLEKLNGAAPHPESLRMIRAIEALERTATPEARQVLETLAKGPGEPRITEEAKASLERLAKRPAVKP
jgi:WD40 repeat protein